MDNQEEQILEICKLFLTKPYVAKEELNRIIKDDVEDIIEEVAERLRQVGVNLELLEVRGIEFIIPVLLDEENILNPENTAILAILGTMERIFGRKISRLEINHYFDQVKTKIRNLEDQRFIEFNDRKEIEITPLGYNMMEELPDKLVQEVKKLVQVSQG